MNADEARHLLQQRDDALNRHTVEAENVLVQVVSEDEGVLEIGGGNDLQLTDASLSEMAKFFSISVNTFRKFPIDLREHTLNRLLREQTRDHDGYLGIYSIADRAIAFTDPGRPHIRCLPVFESALEAINPDGDRELNNFSLTRQGFSVNLMSDRAVDVAHVGDVTQGGLRLKHSDVGAYGTALQAFLLRLICLNGLARASSVARGHFSAEDEFEAGAMVSDWARELYLELDDHLHLYERLNEIALPDPYGAIERLGERNGLSEDCTEMVLDAYALEAAIPDSMYRLTNALTYVSTHGQFDTQTQPKKLQNLADYLVGNGESLCPHCLSPN